MRQQQELWLSERAPNAPSWQTRKIAVSQNPTASTIPLDGKDAIMLRPWLTFFGGLLVSTSLASVAWSQAAKQPTLAERMAALRRGWSQDSSASEKTQRPEQRQEVLPITPIPGNTPSSIPQVNGRSLIPSGLFNRESQQSLGEPAQANTSTARAGSASTTPRVATRNKAGATPLPSSQGSFSLPGLGGTPLPPSEVQATAEAAKSEVSREMARDYPVVQPETHTEDTPSPNVSRTSPDTNANPNVRRSPHVRGPMHVDPQQLRRELSGSFTPAPAATDTGGSNDKSLPPTDTSNRYEQAASDSKIETSGEPKTAATDLSLTLPSADESAASKNEPTIATPSASSTQEETKKGEATEHVDASNSASANVGELPGFGVAPQLRPSQPQKSQSPRHSMPLSTPPRKHPGAVGEGSSATGKESGVLASNQAPIITTDIRGPKQILVGREATYRVQICNQGEVSAERIVASIHIPAWAEVVDTSATQGAIQQSQKSGQSEGVLEWQIAQLDSQATETLDIRLIPKSSRPLELGVTWTVAPVGSRAVVEVQEPKLQMNLSGPDDVLFGKPQLFRLTLTNPGTGVAEGVKISLVPPGAGDDAATSHELGDLAPGTSRSVEVELTAREAGKLNVKATASAEGGLTCDAAKEVFCRKPELEVDWRGPEMKYAGTDATYFFRVRNPGTAPAEEVSVVVSLPEGAELKTASDGQAYDAKRREVAWRVGTLGPGDDSYLELKCVLKTSGTKQLRVTASTAGGELSSTKQAETNVVAIADLKLEVSDPVGPIAVGVEAIYEIRVQNRGANAAKDVNIVALFSEGVEPVQAEGAQYNVADGRVTFNTIEELPAGRQIMLRIRVHALKAGTHVFRAEVLCRDLETKLAAEETTRYYADDAVQRSSEAVPQAAGRTEESSATVR